MIKNESSDAKAIHLIIALSAILSPLLQYLGRSVDDNQLTSWNWVFPNSGFPLFLGVIILAVVCAYPISFFLHHKTIQSRKEIFLVVISFILGAFFWREPEVIVDVSRYFTEAKHLATYGISAFFSDWGKDLFIWTDLPLAPFIYGMGFKLFGESRITVQIITTLFFSGTVLLTFKTGKILWDEEIGWTAALLLLGFPYLYTQVPLMLVDIPTMFFLLLAIYTFIAAMEKGTLFWMGAASIAFFFAFFAKYSTWVLLTVHGVITICYLKKEPLTSLKRAVVVALMAFILIGVAAYPKIEVFTQQIDFLIRYQKPGLKRWGESYLSTFFFQIHPFITCGALFSFWVAVKKRDIKYPIISYLLILLLVILQIKRIRYTLPVFPMVALMASYGLDTLYDSDSKDFLVACIVNSSLAVAFAVFLPFLCNMSDANIAAAGKIIDAAASDEVLVYTNPPPDPIVNPIVYVPILDYFTEKKISYIGGTEPEVSQEKIKTSSLRFTWEYDLPFYYNVEENDGRAKPVVVITGPGAEELPLEFQEKYVHDKASLDLEKTTFIFRNKTFIKYLSNTHEKSIKY